MQIAPRRVSAVMPREIADFRGKVKIFYNSGS
jgi:hypothetical protein